MRDIGLRILHQLFLATEAENKRMILSLLKKNESAVVLDLGCNDGSFTIDIGKRIGTANLYGVEVADEYIRNCQKKGIQVYHADLNEPLPFDSSSFDVVTANQVFEHLHHTDLFIKETKRVLRQDGYAVVSAPNLAAWHNLACLFLGWQPFVANLSDEVDIGNPLRPEEKGARHCYPVHRRIPTYKGIRELFEFHGFNVERTVGVGYYPFPPKAARFLSRIDLRHAVFLTLRLKKRNE
jgi:methionine biosynthesis protein MetW